jgi:hypothetical protein
VGAPTDSAPRNPNYTVKKVECAVAGTDVQARIFTLAPGEAIPWHYHSETTDHYFCFAWHATLATTVDARPLHGLPRAFASLSKTTRFASHSEKLAVNFQIRL